MNKFKVAFIGLINGIKHKSICVQYIITLFVVLFSLYIKMNYIQLIIIIICCFSVITFEYVNTTLEKVCDLITEDYNDKVKNIKDLSAGYVLLQAIMSVIVFLIIIFNL